MMEYFPTRKVEPSIYELSLTYPTAIPLMIKNLRKEIRLLIRHMEMMHAHSPSSSPITLGFLQTLEEKHQEELNKLKSHLSFLLPHKGQTSSITADDIVRAKQFPINTFLKIPSNKKVICLFHNDKQPSMHIYGTTYHCFTCGAHGTTIDIIMRLKNMSFTQAVAFLAIHR